ncbi:MAG: heavy-metal-associated domain-containing protein [Anaerolineae bacterium]|nr:heavy-metal-associated domain-containing protein [Anaerolineae bacterium]
MASKTFLVPNIHCAHCVASIKREVGALEGVQSVAGDPVTKTVTVEWEAPASWERIQELLAEINYPAGA